jgi:hypothetical protein
VDNLLLEPEAFGILTRTRYHLIYSSVLNKVTKPINEVHKTGNLNMNVSIKQRAILMEFSASKLIIFLRVNCQCN